MAETLPIKYVKSDNTTFAPVTSFNCVVDENGKNINDIYINKDNFPLYFINEEYNKTLNLVKGVDGDYTVQASTSTVRNFLSVFKKSYTIPAGSYTLSFEAKSSTSIKITTFGFGNNTTIGTTVSSSFSIDTSYKTFTAKLVLSSSETFNNLYAFCNNSGTLNIKNIILNTDNENFDYTMYSGKIVHKKDIEQYLKGKDLAKLWLEKVYPVGSIYLTIEKASPAAFLGGSWYLVAWDRALWTTTSGAGETISAGLPNITGSFGSNQDQAPNGAFYQSSSGVKNAGMYSYGSRVSMNASRSSSLYGASSTVQPPAYKVYAWRRLE